jgi:ribonuclease VapC
MLRPLPMAIVEADQALATTAGRLRAATAEAALSLGDRFCLALARRDGLPALTADKQWHTVADAAGVAVTVIR